MFAGKKSAQIREILISESAWEEMTCLFAPSLRLISSKSGVIGAFGGIRRITPARISLKAPQQWPSFRHLRRRSTGQA
ncbi:hypothetical protein FZO55_15835 [Enterobacter kobei]|nr:hypothetical protein FZO55_15835 [Enterobacter kobei]